MSKLFDFLRYSVSDYFGIGRILSDNIGYEVTCVRERIYSCCESEGDGLYRVDYTRSVSRAADETGEM